MPTTVLSSKGQIIIPKPLRDAHRWSPGQRLTIIETEDGILLKPAGVFPINRLAAVAGCLSYQGAAKSLVEMDEAIAKGIKERFDVQ